MTFPTRPLPLPAWLRNRRRSAETAYAAIPNEGMDPRVGAVARAVRVAGPETRVAVLAEMLRSGPYRAVPVVDGVADDGAASSAGAEGGGVLLGMVTEADLIDAYLAAGEPEQRARVRSLPARALMRPAAHVVTPHERAAELPARFADAGCDVLPVVADPEGRYFLGLVSRADLVRDLARPFRPPSIGGMATPLGVYLTTGGATGGVGTLALAATGLYTLFLSLVSGAAVLSLERLWVRAEASWPVLVSLHALSAARVPLALREAVLGTLPLVLQYGLFLLLLRLSQLARYHAAEHQVVHAVERGEPLIPEVVRRMPRVHPRCSTNLVAAGLILFLADSLLKPLLHDEATAIVIGGVFAVALWRPFGSFLQERFTTAPAGDKEIESAIKAAREVLDTHGRAPAGPLRAGRRVWSMGFAQILMGASLGTAAVWLLTLPFPAVRAWLGL